jgi:hypothetical protein
VDDFNKIFANDKIVAERFGESIKVDISADNKSHMLVRSVKELPEKVKITDKKEMSPHKSSVKKVEKHDDPDLISLDA